MTPRASCWQCAGASLVDLGDGALLLEFHSKANALGADAFAAVEAALEIVPAAFLRVGDRQPGAVVFGGGGPGRVVDATPRRATWQPSTRMIAGFQCMTTSLRALPFPVVAAPFNMTLGGGCEIMLHSDAVQADAELATGLVELKVGLMPSAGGTTEMLVRYQGRLRPGEEPFDGGEPGVRPADGGPGERFGAGGADDGLFVRRRRHHDEPPPPARRRQGHPPGPGGGRIPAAGTGEGRGARARRVTSG